MEARLTRFLQKSSRPVTALPLMCVFAITVVKAAYFALTHFQLQGSSTFFLLIQNDIQIVGLVGLLTVLSGACNRIQFSFPIRFLAAMAAIWYMVDTAVLIVLNGKVGLIQILQYCSQIFYTNEGTVLFIVSLVLSGFLAFSRIGRIRVQLVWPFLLSLALLFVPPNHALPLLEPLSSSFSFNRAALMGRSVARYASPELMQSLETFSDNGEDHLLSFEDAPNIILLIVESLSAADSDRTSGLNNLLPEFDRISKEGVLFTNMLANQLNTEGGLIALFSGYPPIQFPGADWDLYRSFRYANYLLNRPNCRYTKTFMAPSDITFRGQRWFLEAMGFDFILYQRTVPAFQEGTSYAFKSRPDQVLYEQALKYMDEHKHTGHPLFLVLETTTSHKPYIDPLGRANTAENVWSYVDQQIGRFYDSLAARNFFADGILIVTSDHRKFDMLADNERKLYGARAKFAIPLLVIGSRFEPGRIEPRMFQQSDLIRYFRRTLSNEGLLSEHAILVEFYNKPLFGDAPADLHLASQKTDMEIKTCRVRYFGADFLGSEDCVAPSGAVSYFHRKNAKLQYCFQQRGCQEDLSPQE